MDARTVLQKIRKRGFTIKVIGDNISLAPKRLLNDQMICFIRKCKTELFIALSQEQDEHQASHIERKRALREGRVEVFRILLRRFLNDQKCRQMVNYQGLLPIKNKAIEDYLDIELVNFEYDLEEAIRIYQHYSPPPNLLPSQCLQCGYNKPFCSCKN